MYQNYEKEKRLQQIYRLKTLLNANFTNKLDDPSSSLKDYTHT